MGLEAASRGEVILTHTGSAYTITGPVGSSTLWRLMRGGLIIDSSATRPPKRPMILTETGCAALNQEG
jgi:hypothetical protein